MNKKLPLENPIIKYSPEETFTLAILMQKHDEVNDWIYENFIQLHFYNYWENMYYGQFFCHREDALFINHEMPLWHKCPWFKCSNIPKELIVKEDTWNFIKKCIDNDYYLIVCVDPQYISNYEINSSIHEMLIYGYAQDSQMLYIADFFKNGVYSQSECNINEFLDSFYSENLTSVRYTTNDDFYKLDGKNYDFLNGYQLIKVSSNVEYKLDLAIVKMLIRDYLTGYDTMARYNIKKLTNTKVWFGLDIYDKIIESLSYESEIYEYDVRPFSLLLQHKIFMKKRLEYFCRKKSINIDTSLFNDLNQMISLAEKILRLYLKFHYNNDNLLILKIRKILCEINCKDKRFMENLYNSIT